MQNNGHWRKGNIANTLQVFQYSDNDKRNASYRIILASSILIRIRNNKRSVINPNPIDKK